MDTVYKRESLTWQVFVVINVYNKLSPAIVNMTGGEICSDLAYGVECGWMDGKIEGGLDWLPRKVVGGAWKSCLQGCSVNFERKHGTWSWPGLCVRRVSIFFDQRCQWKSF